MQSVWNMAKLVYRTASLKLSDVPADHTADYNQAASSYDDFYSKYLGKKATEMLDKTPTVEGGRFLDLACGTGFLSHPLARRISKEGTVYAVDLSSGMLQRNKDKAAMMGISNIKFIESDVLDYLSGLPDQSIDGIICAWGICYLSHDRFFKEAERVLRSGGFIGLIENKASTLKGVSDLFRKALIDYPEALVKNVSIDLPKDKEYLAKKATKSGIQVQSTWEGEVKIPCDRGQEILDYVVKSGAASGFLDSIDRPFYSRLTDAFIRYADMEFMKGHGIEVVHEYCALLGMKPSSARTANR